MTTCTCPECGVPLVILVDGEKQTKRKQRNRWPWRWLDWGAPSGTYNAITKQLFKTQAAAIAPAWQAQPAERAPQTQAINVEPGTTRNVEQMRSEMPIDIATYAIKSAMCGIAASVASIGPVLLINKIALSAAMTGKPLSWPWLNHVVSGIRIPWYGPLLVGTTGASIAWFIISNQAKGLITFAENLTRIDLNGDDKTGNVSTYRAKGEVKIGQTTIYTDIPVSDHAQWHAFCKVVAKDEKKFSQVTADEFKIDLAPVLSEWVISLLVDPATVGKQGKRPKLTPAGRGMIRLFATTPPPAAG